MQSHNDWQFFSDFGSLILSESFLWFDCLCGEFSLNGPRSGPKGRAVVTFGSSHFFGDPTVCHTLKPRIFLDKWSPSFSALQVR
jgi:hypothetical protein